MGEEITKIVVEADSTEVEALDKALSKLPPTSKKVDSSTKATSKEFGALKVSVVALGAATLATFTAMGVQSVKTFATLETGLIGVQKTTDFTGTEMETFATNIEGIGRRVPVATESLLQIAGVAGQLGVKGVDNVSKFTETLAKLQLSTDVVGEEGAASIARLLNVTGESVETVDVFGAVLVRLGNNSAATESQILSLATEIGQATSTFAVTSADALAMGAALKSLGVSAELGGSVVGRAMRSIEADIDAGGARLTRLSEVTGIAADKLAVEFGTNSTEVFQMWVAGVGEMVEGGQSASSALAEFGLSGEEVLKVLPTLISNQDKLTDALALSADEQTKVTALNNEAAKAGEALAAMAVTVQNIMGEYAYVIGETLAPYLKDLIVGTKDWHEANGDLLKADIVGWIEGGIWATEKLILTYDSLSWGFNRAIQEIAVLWEDEKRDWEINALALKSVFGVAFEGMVKIAGRAMREIGVAIEDIPGMEDLSNQFKVAAHSMQRGTGAAEEFDGALEEINSRYDTNIRNMQAAQDKIDAQTLGYDKLAKASKNATKTEVEGTNTKLDADKKAEAERERLIKEEERAFEVSERKKKDEERRNAQDRLSLKTRLKDDINQLTQSELDYRLGALQAEIDAMTVTAGEDMELRAMISTYAEAKEKEIREANSYTHKVMREGVDAVVRAVVAGEDVKVAVSRLASEKLSEFAVNAATEGLTAIFSALGGQIGAWIGLGTAQSATDGDTWQQKVASGAGYLAAAAGAVLAGKAIGNSFHAEGGRLGWILRNPNGGTVNEGTGFQDDVFAGYTMSGNDISRNMIMGGEFVVNRKATEANLPLLRVMNASKTRVYAEGGPIANSRPITENINDSGFDTFVDSVIESKGNWKKAIADAIVYYGATGAGMLAGKALGPEIVKAEGGRIGVVNYLDLLDPLGINDKIPGVGGGGGIGIDWGDLWNLLRKLNITGVDTADDILDPFVRDTLTPGSMPTWNTFEAMLEGAYKGTVEDIKDQLLIDFELPFTFRRGGLLGSYEQGTDYIPKTGPYMMHEGEAVLTASDNARLSDEIKDLKKAVSELLSEVAEQTKSTARTLEKWDYDGLPQESV